MTDTVDEPEQPDEAEHDTKPAAVKLSDTLGRPILFVLMTCGFLACLACVLGTVAVVVFAYGSLNDMW
ncbi:MAG TPA: hypothetical protein H9881_06745 [Candidatus Stackebrandtia excrementipullorum]|nr:hypothetical protein [Candidatus Stackebrandtia excrementipullorum]